MTFNHVIKLFVYLFVFLLGMRREDESRLELRALATFVLLLAQRLPGSHNHREGWRETQAKVDGQMDGRNR